MPHQILSSINNSLIGDWDQKYGHGLWMSPEIISLLISNLHMLDRLAVVQCSSYLMLSALLAINLISRYALECVVSKLSINKSIIWSGFVYFFYTLIQIPKCGKYGCWGNLALWYWKVQKLSKKKPTNVNNYPKIAQIA